MGKIGKNHGNRLTKQGKLGGISDKNSKNPGKFEGKCYMKNGKFRFEKLILKKHGNR